MRGAKITKKCNYCEAEFEARLADHNRGWAKFCSKSCKAKHQTKLTNIAGPHYKAEGKTVEQMRNGSYAKSKFKGRRILPKEITHDEYGVAKECHCGELATHFVQSGFGHNGWEGMCDNHVDDTHPFDGGNFS